MAMKCPHCTVGFHDKWSVHNIGNDRDADNWLVNWLVCPNCNRLVVRLVPNNAKTSVSTLIVKPAFATRPVPPHVPDPYATDFAEACAALSISPKASAAISRRLLQHILRDKAGAKKKDLVEQIEELQPTLPGHLQDLHAIRQIGNFAAHPSKSAHTGEIVEVEPGEAEWLLDILERVLDFYFVQPVIRQKQIIELNAKLKAAGKPELPVPPV
jgi:hypothetical protein